MTEPAAASLTVELSPHVAEVHRFCETFFGDYLLHDQLGDAGKGAGHWLWEGYLASGKITLFTAQWKSGKTTLISVLLSRMEQGGQLAGLNVAKGRAAIISEEGPENWDARCRQLQMGKHLPPLQDETHEHRMGRNALRHAPLARAARSRPGGH